MDGAVDGWDRHEERVAINLFPAIINLRMIHRARERASAGVFDGGGGGKCARPLVGNWTSPRLPPSLPRSGEQRDGAWRRESPFGKVTAAAMPEEETTAALWVSSIGGGTICGSKAKRTES